MFHELKKKIQNKMIGIVVIALTFTVGINYWIGNNILKKELLKAESIQAVSYGESLKNQLESLLAYGVGLEDLVGFDAVCEELVEKNEILAFTMAVDLQGKILFSSNLEEVYDIGGQGLVYEQFEKAEYRMIEVKKQNEDYLIFMLPFYNQWKQHIGMILVGTTKDSLVKPIEFISITTFLVALASMLIAVIIIIVAVSLWITGPLGKLYSATRKIMHNGTEDIEEVAVYANDEIGELAQSFNKMIAYLKETTVSKDYLDNIITSMTESLIVLSPEYKIEMINKEAVTLLGYSEDELLGQPIDKILLGKGVTPFFWNYFDLIKQEGILKNREAYFKTKTNERIPILFCSSVMKAQTKDVTHLVCTAKDMTEIKEAEKVLYKQANFDMLTGLNNRYYLEKKISEYIKDGKVHTFLSLDLDKFKMVNDACGHHAGDQLLKNISSMMRQVLRKSDILARVGGDEFAVLLPYTTLEEGEQIGEMLCNMIKEFRFIWHNKPFTIGVSIGAVQIDETTNDIEWLLSVADRACYLSKEKGGNRVQRFDPTDKELSIRHEEIDVMSCLAGAFAKDRFFMAYQPIVAVSSQDNRIWHEALIRMEDETGRVVQPNILLSAAQRYNRLVDIDKWVVNHFASHYWEGIGKELKGIPHMFNINISGASLSSTDFGDYICEVFERYDIPAEVVCFEITETSVVSNFTEAKRLISRLREKGCSFALDDFGTGVSSFSYLKYLAVDYLKIDGEFVKDMADNKVDYAMVASIHEIAHLMGIRTIAEYVESEAIMKCLGEIGVDFAQGYWIGKPDALQAYVGK